MSDSDRDEILARLKALLEGARCLDDPTLLPEMQGLVQDAQTSPVPQTTTASEHVFQGMIGSCPAMLDIRELCTNVALKSCMKM